MRHLHFYSMLLLGALTLGGCQRAAPVDYQEGSGHDVLTPLADSAVPPARARQLVYVPVYSSIYWGFDRQMVELAATLSIRNVSPRHALVVHSVKYFDSRGRPAREYVRQPGALAPMATADFVIQRQDTAGGPGANFLVDWSGAGEMGEPVFEAVMIGQHGNAGISFTSVGRPLPKASADRTPQPASGAKPRL